VDVADLDLDPAVTGVALTSDTSRRGVDHPLGGRLVQRPSVFVERTLREARMESALHSAGIAVEPAFEVVEYGVHDRHLRGRSLLDSHHRLLIRSAKRPSRVRQTTSSSGPAPAPLPASRSMRSSPAW
jgi:hypothetical protein